MVELKYVEDDRGHSLVNIVEPDVPGSECEIWCYEDPLQNAVDHGGGGTGPPSAPLWVWPGNPGPTSHPDAQGAGADLGRFESSEAHSKGPGSGG